MTERYLLCPALLLLGLTSCSSSTRLECQGDEDCDDGLLCSGPERCQGGHCLTSEPLRCGDDVGCTRDACFEEVAGGCSSFPDHEACPDGELCDPEAGCLGVDGCLQDEDCDDGVFCNGAEVCGEGLCRSGERPGCDDGETCTLDTCHEGLDRCVSSWEPPDEDGDGFGEARCGGEDCDDGDAGVHPGAAEACDDGALDLDCDGARGCDDGDCEWEPGCWGPSLVAPQGNWLEINSPTGVGGYSLPLLLVSPTTELVSRYGCGTDDLIGPEWIGAIHTSVDVVLSVSIGDPRCYLGCEGPCPHPDCERTLFTDLDLFVLESDGSGCRPERCLAQSAQRGLMEEEVTAELDAGGDYCVIIDSPSYDFYGGDCDAINEYMDGYWSDELPDRGTPICTGVPLRIEPRLVGDE